MEFWSRHNTSKIEPIIITTNVFSYIDKKFWSKKSRNRLPIRNLFTHSVQRVFLGHWKLSSDCKIDMRRYTVLDGIIV